MAVTDTITQQEQAIATARGGAISLYKAGAVGGQRIKGLYVDPKTREDVALTRQSVKAIYGSAGRFDLAMAELAGGAKDIGEAQDIVSGERQAMKRAGSVAPETFGREPPTPEEEQEAKATQVRETIARIKQLSPEEIKREWVLGKSRAAIKARSGQRLTFEERARLGFDQPTGTKVTLTKMGTPTGGLAGQPIGYGGISDAFRFGAFSFASQVDVTLRNKFGGIDIVEESQVGDDYVIKLSKEFKGGKAGIEQFKNAVIEAKKFNKYAKVVKISDTEYRIVQTFPKEAKKVEVKPAKISSPIDEILTGTPEALDISKRKVKLAQVRKGQLQKPLDVDEERIEDILQPKTEERDKKITEAFLGPEPKPTDIITVTKTDASGKEVKEKMTYRKYLLEKEEADIFNQAFERDVKLKEDLGISEEQLGPFSPETLVEYGMKRGQFTLTPSFEGEEAVPTFDLKTKKDEGPKSIYFTEIAPPPPKDYKFAKVFESGGKEVGAIYGEDIPKGAFGTQEAKPDVKVISPITTKETEEQKIEERVFGEAVKVQELQERFEKSIGIPQIDFYPIKGIKEFSTGVSTKVREAAVTAPQGLEWTPIKFSLYATAGITSIPAMFIEIPEFAGKTLVATKGIVELGLSGEEKAFKERARGSAVALYSVATDPSFYVETAGAVLGLGLLSAIGKVGITKGRITSPKAKSVDVFAFIETEAKVTSNILTTKQAPKGIGRLPATIEQIKQTIPKEPVGITKLTGKARGFVRGEPELGFIERIKGEPAKEPLLGEFDIEFKQEKFTKPQDLPSEGVSLRNIEAVTDIVGEVKVKGKKAPIEIKQFTKEQLVEPSFDYDIQSGRFLSGKGGVPDIFKKQGIPEARIPQPEKFSFTYSIQKGKPISETFGFSKQVGTLKTRLGEAAVTAGEVFKLERPRIGEPTLGESTIARGLTFDIRGKTPRSLDFYLRELSLKYAKEGFEKVKRVKKDKPTPEKKIQLPKEVVEQLITKTEQLYIDAPFEPPKGAFVFGEKLYAVPKVSVTAKPPISPEEVLKAPEPKQVPTPKAVPKPKIFGVEVKQAGGMVQIQKTKTVTQQLQTQKQQQVTKQRVIQQTKVSTQQKTKQIQQLSSRRTKQLQQVLSPKTRFRGLSTIAPITLPKQTTATLEDILTRQDTKVSEKTKQKEKLKEKQKQKLRELQPQLDLQKQQQKTLTGTRQRTVTRSPPKPFEFPPFEPQIKEPTRRTPPFLLPEEEISRKKKKKRVKDFRRKFGYRPDIVTQAFGITATEVKKGDVLTGIGLRPVIRKKRRM